MKVKTYQAGLTTCTATNLVIGSHGCAICKDFVAHDIKRSRVVCNNMQIEPVYAAFQVNTEDANNCNVCIFFLSGNNCPTPDFCEGCWDVKSMRQQQRRVKR